MKTLQDFKDKLAQVEGYFNWGYLEAANTPNYIDSICIELADKAAKIYAEYMAIEFDNWIFNNCEDVDGGRIYKGKTYSTKELYEIFKEENNQ